MKTPIANHTSPETAYVIEDYPYGFKLRCKIRYWLETNNKGTRFCSQTTNPKRGGTWNNPKYSTYAAIAGAMYLDENNHVQWEGLNEYAELDKCKEYLETFGDAISDFQRVKNWTRKQEIFEEELSKFNPVPSYGTELFKSAYRSMVHRCRQEGI